MRFRYIILFVLSIAIANAASLDGIDLNHYPVVTAVPAHETKWAKWLKPLRKIIDRIFHRKVTKAEGRKAAAELPWSLINIPSYANWTSTGWNVHVHANLYKRQSENELSSKKIDRLLEKILLRATIKKPKFWSQNAEWLKPEEAAKGRDFIRNIATYSLRDGIINATIPDADCNLQLPVTTNSEGSVTTWLTLDPSCGIDPPSDIIPSSVTPKDLKLVPINVAGAQDESNSPFDTTQMFLVPPYGLTIVSDVDDVLRVAEVWNPKQAILDMVTRPYEPWLNMSDMYWR